MSQIKGMMQANVFQVGSHVGVILEAAVDDPEAARKLSEVLGMKIDILVKLAGGLPIHLTPVDYMESETFEEAIQEIARTFFRSL